MYYVCLSLHIYIYIYIYMFIHYNHLNNKHNNTIVAQESEGRQLHGADAPSSLIILSQLQSF